MLILWTNFSFLVFDTYLISTYFQLQSVNYHYFWPICLNEPKECLFLFQRTSVNRKPNKWLYWWNKIFSKMCWQDFMKYIHFMALHIQNNCAKFQRILPMEYGLNFTFFSSYRTHNRGRLCCHGNQLLSKFIGNKIFARAQCRRHKTIW